MIYCVAHKLSLFFNRRGYIPIEEVDLIEYGIFSVVSKLLYGFITFLIGLIMGCVVEATCFYFSFLYIKKYAGGIHASTENRCFIASTLSIICSVICIFLSIENMCIGYIIMAITLPAVCIILKLAPMPAKEKPLDHYEIKRYSKMSIVRICVLVIIIFLMYSIDLPNLVFSICVAIILEGILVLLGKIQLEKSKT